jgi:hypothetical protein
MTVKVYVYSYCNGITSRLLWSMQTMPSIVYQVHGDNTAEPTAILEMPDGNHVGGTGRASNNRH